MVEQRILCEDLFLCHGLCDFPLLGVGFMMKKFRLDDQSSEQGLLARTRAQAETIDSLNSQFLWFGCATLLLLLDIFHQSFKVHLGQAKALEHPVVSMVVYVVFTTAWSIALIVKFMRRP